MAKTPKSKTTTKKPTKSRPRVPKQVFAFAVDEYVVYPTHGVGKITGI